MTATPCGPNSICAPLDLGTGNRWVLSDLDGSMRTRPTADDHVIGVGHASLSLLQGTPTRPVGTVLDVGTGCGIQALRAADYAGTVTATDVNPRATDLTAATAALNGLDFEILEGSWFEPVAGRTFDQIVANPPFVCQRGPGGQQLPRLGSGPRRRERTDDLRSRGPSRTGRDSRDARVVAARRRRGLAPPLASWLPAHGVDA